MVPTVPAPSTATTIPAPGAAPAGTSLAAAFVVLANALGDRGGRKLTVHLLRGNDRVTIRLGPGSRAEASR